MCLDESQIYSHKMERDQRTSERLIFLFTFQFPPNNTFILLRQSNKFVPQSNYE